MWSLFLPCPMTLLFPIYTSWYSQITSMLARQITHILKEIGNHNWHRVTLKFYVHQKLRLLLWPGYIARCKEHVQSTVPVEINKSRYKLEYNPMPAPPVIPWSWALPFLSRLKMFLLQSACSCSSSHRGTLPTWIHWFEGYSFRANL